MKKICCIFFVYLFTSINLLSAEQSFQCFDSPSKDDSPQSDMILLSMSHNLNLAEKIAIYLDIPLHFVSLRKIHNRELLLANEDALRGKNILILQPDPSTAGHNMNDDLVDLYLLVRSMKRASIASITAIIPYYKASYSNKGRPSPTACTIATIVSFLQVAGIDRVATLDLNHGEIQGFFRNTPVDNLYTASLFAPYFAVKDLSNIVVVAPDEDGMDRVKKFAEGLELYGIQAELALVNQQPESIDSSESWTVSGNVKNADVILVHDLCSSEDTLIKTANLLREKGANRVFAIISHPVFSDAAIEKIGHSIIEELVIANTVPLQEAAPANIRCIPITPLLSTSTNQIQLGESLAELFSEL